MGGSRIGIRKLCKYFCPIVHCKNESLIEQAFTAFQHFRACPDLAQACTARPRDIQYWAPSQTSIAASIKCGRLNFRYRLSSSFCSFFLFIQVNEGLGCCDEVGTLTATDVAYNDIDPLRQSLLLSWVIRFSGA
jgi:hypothetical protein